MGAKFISLPQFNAFQRHSIAAPMWRSRNVLSSEFGFNCVLRLLHGGASCNRLTLRAGPSADLIFAPTCEPVGVALRFACVGDSAFNIDLPTNWMFIPMKKKRRAWVRLKRERLATFAVGVEHCAVIVKATQ